MPVSLVKGGNTQLPPGSNATQTMRIGLGWNARVSVGDSFDLDACAFLLDAGGKVRSDGDFVFYNQPKSPEGAVEHSGDNRTGDGDGDDETILVHLSKVPENVAKVAVAVNIHDAATRRQNFGMVSDAFIRVVDDGNGSELVRYDLGEDFSTETSVVFGEIYRHTSGWKFRAVGQGVSGGIEALARGFGVSI